MLWQRPLFRKEVQAVRGLVWFTLGFVLSCTLCGYGLGRSGQMILLAACLMLAGVCLFFGRKKMPLRCAGVVCIGCILGLGWFLGYHSWRLAGLIPMNGTEQTLELTASDYSRETEYGVTIEGTVILEGKPYTARAWLKETEYLQPGDQIVGSFRLETAAQTEDKTATYDMGNGIFVQIYQTGDCEIRKADAVPMRYRPAVMRRQLTDLLNTLFPEDAAPFAVALFLGDTEGLDYETDTALKISGIRHVVAVSGLHVSILYGLVCMIAFRRRFLTALLGIPTMLFFAAMVGFSPSVTRACIMVCLMMAAVALNREYDPGSGLAFAVLVMLMINPFAVLSVSLQMSACCVTGILLFQKRIEQWLISRIPKPPKFLTKGLNGLCGSIAVSISTMSLVSPLSVLYFGAVSLVSVLTNLLTLWAVTVIFCGLFLLCLVYLILPGATGFLAAVLTWLIRYVLGVAKLVSGFPLAAVYGKSVYILLWIIFIYVLLAVFLIMKEKKPGILLCCGILGLCLALAASWFEPVVHSGRITLLDVGQGQSVILQSRGKTFLVDCGGSDDEQTADLVADTLLSQGIFCLDGIIVTHHDRDHAGGLSHLLQRVDTRLLFLPDTPNEMILPENGGEIVYVWENLELTFDTTTLTIYGPVYSGQDNENSLCVLFDTEKCDILITGDRSAFGERMLLRQSGIKDVDILVAGHHGARNSTSEELLSAVTPELVLISAGRDNPYGHPSPALLERLEAAGCEVYRTDLHGTITIGR